MQINSQRSSEKLASSEHHVSVLLQEVLDGLQITKNSVVVDATVGGAGHLKEFSKLLSKKGTLIGIDADPEALTRAEEALSDAKPTVVLIPGNFRDIRDHLESRDIPQITHALFDLGWSGFQLTVGRGFSFLTEEPLLMTYGIPEEETLTAKDLINSLDEDKIADIIFAYGEERFARRIAKSIVETRSEKDIETTSELAAIVKRSVPAWYRHRKTHPATKTFQALRIAVNDELEALRDGLKGAIHLLAPGGRVAVITFHSIEDRIVKRFFEGLQREGVGVPLTKKPIPPTEEEVKENPRARSAKLRVFVKS
ncbi:16S rRNA (cytosine(1402)-N(4))-methyltransferase RsmH [Candidatus Wolfebacteria bacterium]|nr:16S rRNA (cytosine(1402)-N(4))-methyltransferase RsmH [Candidatus Wolfebacteria bacterium]